MSRKAIVQNIVEDVIAGRVASRKVAIISLNNATDGAEGSDLRGFSGLISSLTQYEKAVVQDIDIHGEAIIRGDGEYILRGHVVEESAVEELLASGYLEESDNGIGLSGMFKAKKRLYTAARGQQTRRKDKDLMRDTGGTSKGRDNEPDFKPPRDDVKKRYRDRRKTPDQNDTDTNENNKDRPVKKPSRRPMEKKASVHPLDRTEEGAWGGLALPEQNFHRKVFGALWCILERAHKISEKDFTRQDWIKAECDRVVRSPEAEEIIQRLEGRRPEYCAEIIFDQILCGK